MSQTAGQAAAPARADAQAWLSVAAGTIGALMATLDISITNAALPVIQGEIGASPTEATWVSTAYLVAEIVMIPLTGWFSRIFGIRDFLLLSTVLFTAFSVMCGMSSSLTMMIVGRIGQGFFGGAMIPTALTIVSTRLPPAQQPIGIALFGMTAVLGPVVGPLLGGWLTEHVSWHYAFFLNIPVGIGLVGLLFFGLHKERLNPAAFWRADWLGIFGLSLALGALTVVLEEGQRDMWFDSPLIRGLSAATVLGLIALLIGQKRAAEPVIDLSILKGRAFFGVFVLSLSLGAGLYGVLYLIPQFLAAVPGYNAQQSGVIVLISGVPTMMIMPFFPWLVRHLDLRLAVAGGMALFAWGCWVDITLTAQSSGDDFTLSQVLRGFGQGFALLFLNQAAASSVPPEKAEDASGLFNAARNLGGSVGLSMIATLQDRRGSFHAERLAEALPAGSPQLQGLLHGDGGTPQALALKLQLAARVITEQALVMTFNDLFYVFALLLFVCIPLAVLLRPLPKGAGLAIH
ncbi:Multidrug export protein EmrB [bioreactor metagenome]|uniref:Multidrug export protein EmrB n=1 Tax=bioreactor metagenome TaxID=1076179 RepID=A0A644WMY3_9ZZZZ